MAPGRARRTGAASSADHDWSCSSRGEVLQATHLRDPQRAGFATQGLAPDVGVRVTVECAGRSAAASCPA
jgi:hypothetical protein